MHANMTVDPKGGELGIERHVAMLRRIIVFAINEEARLRKYRPDRETFSPPRMDGDNVGPKPLRLQ